MNISKVSDEGGGQNERQKLARYDCTMFVRKKMRFQKYCRYCVVFVSKSNLDLGSAGICNSHGIHDPLQNRDHMLRILESFGISCRRVAVRKCFVFAFVLRAICQNFEVSSSGRGEIQKSRFYPNIPLM